MTLCAAAVALAMGACSSDPSDPDGGKVVNPDDETGRQPYTIPTLTGQLLVGHFLGNYEIYSFATASLAQTTGSPYVVGAPAGQVMAIGKHNVVAVVLEGLDSYDVVVLDAATLRPIAGSPYSTDRGPTAMAHDDARDRLFITCISTPGVPTESSVTVYDTSSVPWQELAGSPIPIDVPAFAIQVDPVLGRLYGISLTRLWAVELTDQGFVHLAGSPVYFDSGSGSDVAIDPERRRVYFLERRIPGPQLLHAYSLESFTLEPGSPLSVAGAIAGDFTLNLRTGDIYLVDYGDGKLHSIATEPLALRNTCGQYGCDIPTTETGLALDYERDRLFLPQIPSLAAPDEAPGALSVWDVSDPAMPSEITTSANRPALGLFPNRMSIH
ncbi:MAG: hypothetical protein V3T05_08255 [Myxococcota bacterium]